MRTDQLPQTPSKALIAACRVFAKTVSRLFWRIEFRGTANIPDNSSGGFIIAANHQTYLDPVWISIPILRAIHYLAWDRAFRWPVVGYFIRHLGALPVRLGRGATYGSLRASLDVLRAGGTIMIFPEGEREFADGKLLAFKPGAVRLAATSGVPILPVTIKGGNRVWPRGSLIPRPRKVEIIYHPVFRVSDIYSEDPSSTDLRQKTDLLKAIVGRPLSD